jgi:hypothetical protein
MTTRRTRITREPLRALTPEIVWAFQQLKKLSTQCTCSTNWKGEYWKKPECKACDEWWEQHKIIHHGLRLPPHFWPCLPIGEATSRKQQTLYTELENAAGVG